jgi:apolipoprotein N-acyltransferase
MKVPAAIEFLAALAGGAAVAGFAPYGFWPAPILSLFALMLLWRRSRHRAAAAELGFLWGMGFFMSGVSWIYISLHDFGGMPWPLAVLAIVLFSALLALFPAAVGYLALFFRTRPKTCWLLAAPALWTLSEWVRSWFLTGFPWLSLGYAQTPDGPLAGYAPVLGVFGVSWASALLAGLLVVLVTARDKKGSDHLGEEMGSDHLGRPSGQTPFPPFPLTTLLGVPLAILLLVGGGVGLKQVNWTQPWGSPLTVSLLQGNFPQNQKFAEESLGLTFQRYTNMLQNSSSRLIVLPESALPLMRQELPESLVESITQHGYDNDGDVLVGLFSEPERHQYYNSVFSFGHSPPQTYQKVHLVPFGEFIPLGDILKPLVNAVLTIPLDDQQHGPLRQDPLRVAGQHVAMDICYEDAFGEEIIRALPRATLLANVTNDAWFGGSIGPEQHLQMSQTRAMETGRWMIRATNTGVTAIIDEKGHVTARAPRDQIFTLDGTVQGFQGSTPFVVLGNYGILAICLLALILSIPFTREP